MSDWDVVNLLRHARHDWLNKLQLIKGNISLNHIERANEIIEELIIEARHEAKLSNLHSPKLAELLLTFNWDKHKFYLETEVIGDEVALTPFEEPLVSFISEFFRTLDQCISLPNEHHMLLSLKFYDDKIRVSFDFNGYIEGVGHVKEWLQHIHLHKSTTIIESYITEEEILITLQVQ